jgi:hypothetical protein
MIIIYAHHIIMISSLSRDQLRQLHHNRELQRQLQMYHTREHRRDQYRHGQHTHGQHTHGQQRREDSHRHVFSFMDQPSRSHTQPLNYGGNHHSKPKKSLSQVYQSFTR